MLDLYVQEHNDRLPSCVQLPSVNTNLPSVSTMLAPHLRAKAVFQRPADRTLFPAEQTSYEWNMFLNGASYDHPEDRSPATQAIVELVFGGRLNTPLCSDAKAFPPAGGIWTGKNALYFGGRVEKAKVK